MKIQYIALGICMSLLSCSGPDKDTAVSDDNLMEASRQELATALEERDRLLALVTDISASMEEVKRIEQIVAFRKSGQSEGSSAPQRVMSDLQAIRRTLAQRRSELSELELKLKQSELFNSQMQSVIDMLHKQISTQAEEIKTLGETLDAANEYIAVLNTAVDSLSDRLDLASMQRDSIADEARRVADELNTCYYVVAPRGELKEHRILETGFLRKTKLMKGDFDQHVFKVADKRRLRTVHVPGRKADLLTNHPPRSYRLTAEGDSIRMHIIDPERFWTLTNYMVIQTD